ncbi:fused MFS/spermidine synthase [Teredinibacter waterburyi]|jgi:Spermidine synthase|uniref:fused MFS/spermidine synthase n=1 Tax=Teredinibacter waterburyi TaxID=1500538 RepID=UPI00165FA678|nr:fused MFS/spermidine synthase [Teredinibacter waterburyi]
MKNKTKQPTSRQHQPLDKLVFYGTVVITGAAVMMVELLGTRIIGPFYGVSLIVWSSLLSVSLLALSMGYYVGGYCADKITYWRLPHAVISAAILIAVIPLISKPVQLMFDGLGLRLGALASAFVLFTPSLLFLGMAGPFVIRMATDRLENVGSTAGNVYAISTVGSVVGTLMLGFYLLPLYGTHTILLVLALVLLCLAVALSLYEKSFMTTKYPAMKWAGVSVVLIAVLAWQMFSGGRNTKDDNYQVLFEQETHYGWVRVVQQQDNDIRWLMSDASTIGAEYVPTGVGLLGYQTVVRLLPWFNPNGKKGLLIGLGAGHLVNDLANYGVATDAIEIDPAVAYAANKYFNFKPTGKVIVGDARYQVRQLNETYDLIIHDCFTGGSEPIHLLSEEMMLELKAKLNPGGVLAVNFVGFTDAERLTPVKSVARTLDSVFAHRKTYVRTPGEEFSDYVFVVSDTELNSGQHPNSQQPHQWLSEREVAISGVGGELITDDYNPLEYLQIAKAEHYRNVLIDRVGESVLFR